jgi:hypothetical protein
VDEAPLIFFEEQQVRNFYPAGDVDRARFLAKAGRYYRITTLDLAPGVDTVLSVTVGSDVYVNDDQQLGDLSSEVTVRGLPGRDVEAEVVVTNRGRYGPERTYTLYLEEILPTPTPTEPSPVTPTPTLTPEGGAEAPIRPPGLARGHGQGTPGSGAVRFVIYLEIRAETR